MIAYGNLRTELNALEEKWFAYLRSLIPCIPHSLSSIASDYVQFFEGENTPGSLSETTPLPLVVGVGINYGASGLRSSGAVQPFLKKRHGTWTEAGALPHSASNMRKAVDAYLGAYNRCSKAWTTNRYASGRIPTLSQQYILVAINPCPFLTDKNWGRYPLKEQTHLLNAWNPNNHLTDFITRLGKRVDLWVVHGVDAAWPLANVSAGIPVLYTGCLTKMVYVSKHIASAFWTKPRLTKQRHPTWHI